MPATLLVREGEKAVERDPSDLSELRDRPCWLDLLAPTPDDLDLVAKELDLHPLAVEDALQASERAKIEEYEGHYFIVFHAIEEPDPDVIRTHQVAIFVLKNAIVTVHAEQFSVLAGVEKRFREGRMRTTGLLLHALLDGMVDQYYEVVDGFGDRVEMLEQFIVAGSSSRAYETTLRELFILKRDLLRIRQIVTPERDVLQVLSRGDIEELREEESRAYYQDVYDHLVRVVDEIDTFRDLSSNVIDALLAAASNRLNEVMKVLTSVATVLLVFSVVTSFFGMNFQVLPFDSPVAFWLMVTVTALSGVVLFIYFRRKDYL